MAETLSTLSIISFVIAGVSLAIAIFLWIYFRIPTVIGDLSGRNAKKSIARMRASNEKSGNKSYRASETNAERGKLTGTMPGIGEKNKEKKNSAKKDDKMPETGLLAENKANDIGEETDLLVEEDTNETDLLIETPITVAPKTSTIKLEKIEEVVLVHTDEVIE